MKVVFEHDGAPFSLGELAALLSGGSSKEYESETTTGRFGTGFLVTHVLAERTKLSGLLRLPTGCEAFDVTLDRAGDEDAILDNIRHSNDAIRSAVPVSDPAAEQSAVLEYAYSEGDVWGLGLQELRRALPYLYGTRENLGDVEIQAGASDIQTWQPSAPHQVDIEDGYAEYRAIAVTGADLPRRELRVYRFAKAQDATAVALVVTEQTSNGLRVCLPERDAPRVFREYPLRSSGFVPVNFILDGKFDPDQERSGLLMSPNDKNLIEEALSAAVVTAKYGVDHEWTDAHWLAHASCPSAGFNATDNEEKDWWTKQLAAFAQRLANLPIVKCGSKFLPALINDGEYADFICPRLLAAPGTDETSVDRMWPLVQAAENLLPPCRELAGDWTTIVDGWRSLGLTIEPLCLVKLADWVRADDGKTLEELKVEGDAQEWLATFVDIVGECWRKRKGTDLSALRGMMPNQNRRLCSPSELKREQSVPEQLKEICTGTGYDIREQLLLGGFEEIAHSRGLCHLTEALVEAIPRHVTEDEIIADAVENMSRKLPEDRSCDNVSSNVQQATVRLLAHLWESRVRADASIARQVPLIASSGRAVRWSPDRLFMAPVRAWPESAQPFAGAYPPNRVLHDLYAGSETDQISSVSVALTEWGIALANPITDSTVELKDRRLAALSDSDANGIVVPGEHLSQIALLQPEVLNRCQEGIDEARALFGLVLCYVARHDPEWKKQRSVRGRRLKEVVEVSIRGALWLADLKVRAWVPVPGEDDKPQKMVASAATLKGLLDPTWLQDNDDGIRLLSEWFGFDQLELRLMGIAQDERERQELRNSLARLVETGGADPEFYAELAEEVQARRQRSRDVERCRNLGLAVQEAIGAALERHKLSVKLVDRGFD